MPEIHKPEVEESVGAQITGIEPVQEERHFSRAVMESVNVGIIACDQNGKITFFNAAMQKIHGIPDSVISPEIWSQYFDLYQPDGKTLLTKEQVPLYRALKGETIRNQEILVLRKNQDSISLLVSGQPIVDQDGNRCGAVVVAHDVTDIKRTELQLRQAQKMEAIGQLAGGVAHDFNNILMAISGYCELMLMQMVDQDPMKEVASEIFKAVERGTALARQLLAFSRKQVTQSKILDLNQVITGMENLLRRVMKEDVELAISSDPGLGKVKADPTQIEQVIMNLAINARDAMPRGGKLMIETTNVRLDDSYAAGHISVVPGEYVMLSVSDTGVGMDEATQSRIFEPFFTTKEEGRGTGLGLSTVYGTIKQNGGFIWVYSEPEQGSTFKIYLPRVKEGTEPVQPASSSNTALNGRETILLVDDNESVRVAFSALLEFHGYKVLRAANGQEALEVASQYAEPIHVLVTDLVMPGIGGRELSRMLLGRGRQMKVIYMSGYTGEAASRQGILDPESIFLQKPASIRQLLQKIHEVLS